MFNETADRNGFNAATTFMSILYNRGYIFDENQITMSSHPHSLLLNSLEGIHGHIATPAHQL